MYSSNEEFLKKLDQLEKLFENDPQAPIDNPDVLDEYGISLLGHAVYHNCKTAFIQYLIKKGADVKNLKNGDNRIIVYALEHGNPETLAILLTHGAPTKSAQDWLREDPAIRHASSSLFRILHKKHDREGLRATKEQHEQTNEIISRYMQCIILLINHGCAIDFQEGLYLLHSHGIHHGVPHLVELLFRLKIDPRVLDDDKNALERSKRAKNHVGSNYYHSVMSGLLGVDVTAQIIQMIGKRIDELNEFDEKLQLHSHPDSYLSLIPKDTLNMVKKYG